MSACFAPLVVRLLAQLSAVLLSTVTTGPPVMRHLRLRRREEYLPPWVLALAPRLGTAAIAPGTLAQGVWALPH